jgi:DNA-binding response OmpR family regulator
MGLYRDERCDRVILLVEDNDRIRNAEAQVLGDCGYAVLTAADAATALQHLAESRVDLMITDIRLPGSVNGIALAKLTRACWPSTKIMIVGADAGQFTAEDGRDLADDMLQKPFKLAELEERSAKLMRIGGYAA